MKEACLIVAVVVACVFAFRYLTLVKALGVAERGLQEIQRDFSQNRFLHLPLPNTALERLVGTVNAGLEGIRRERREYAKREKEFQQQIENISHDLRTPLTVILGYLQLMKEAEARNNKEQEQVLAILERNARAMERLVGQFYLYSLLQNAGRYAASELRIRLEEEPDGVKIFFANDTDRLSEGDLPHLFERFYKQGKTRDQGGSGLGLTVAKGLAEAMKGKLTAELMPARQGSEEGTATEGRKVLRFQLWLGRG